MGGRSSEPSSTNFHLSRDLVIFAAFACAGVRWSLSACEILVLALEWLHVVRMCKAANGFRVGRRQMPAAMMRGSDAAMTTNGPLMACKDRITQPVRGLGGTITPLTSAIAAERVTRIELA
jgi:hypothetical protein